MKRFKDRQEAGRCLAKALAPYEERPRALLLALPRGGVPVAYEVAVALRLPLDVFLVRKLGVPRHEEWAMGAIASGGVSFMNADVVKAAGVSDLEIAEVSARETTELQRRARLYRQGLPPLDVKGRPVILIDDGMATGASMLVALRALRQQGASSLAIAVPLAPASTTGSLRHEADAVVCLRQPEPFYGVGLWYEDFPQVSDQQVCTLLAKARRRQEAGTWGAAPANKGPQPEAFP